MSRVNYHDYLKLDSLLGSQKLLSQERGRPAHDEALFISVHHSYEIWFKQILFELDSVLEFFKKPFLSDESTGVLIQRLDRIHMILKNLITQVDILETMTPLDFLEFRDLLYPASGFQSFQFRLLENKLGLPSELRHSYNQKDYKTQLLPHQSQQIEKVESEPSLFDLVEEWLERTPFLDHKSFSFWDKYKESVQALFEKDKSELEKNSFLGEEEKKAARNQIGMAEAAFQNILDPEAFEDTAAGGVWRLSHRALRAALLIQLYRDLPVFQMPFRMITLIQEIDHDLTQWRYRHALMVQKMLGRRVGTGGSSGGEYLQKTAKSHQVFKDFNQLTTFLIPRSQLPPIPDEVKKDFGFFFTGG